MASTAGSDPLVRGVDDVLITAELASRPSRRPDYEAESRALGRLAQEMATNPRAVLQKCAELVMELCHADSAGISILEPGGTSGILRWHAAAGGFAPNLYGTMPVDASPCGTVIERNRVLLFNEAERCFPALRGVEPRIYENLLAPWHVKGKAVGTLWAIKHTPEGRFDAEDARVLQSLARFAAAAFQMTLALDEAIAERSASREGEERQRFLLHLSDALRPLADASEIQATTTRLLGEHLWVDRSMYGEVVGERGAEVGTIRGQYVRPAAEGGAAAVPFPEHFTFNQFGAHTMAAHYRGETLVVGDVESDPAFSAAERAAWVAADVRAAIVATLVKGGRLVAEFGVHSAAPRAWTEAEIVLVREVAERTWAAAERARADGALRESEGRAKLLLAELQHRVRNILAMVRSVVRRTVETSESVGEVGEHLDGRLSSMARTQTMLTRSAGAGVELALLIREELLAQNADEATFLVEGPTIELAPKAAEVLTLAIHELATNATKYGAFAHPGATLEVSWNVERNSDRVERLRLVWQERGVPVLANAPRRTGFGTELIERRVPYELHGTGEVELRPGGVRAEITFPLVPGESILATRLPSRVSPERSV